MIVLAAAFVGRPRVVWDPLEQRADVRQANRYAYVGGDPLNATDPSGLGLIPTLDDVKWAVKKIPGVGFVGCYAEDAVTDTDNAVGDEAEARLNCGSFGWLGNDDD